MPDNRTELEKQLGRLLIDTALTNINEKTSGFVDDNIEGDLDQEYSCLRSCLENCSVTVPDLSGQALSNWLTDLLNNPENSNNQCVTEEYDANCMSTSGNGCIPKVISGQITNAVVLGSQEELTTIINNYLDSRQDSYEIQVNTIRTKISLWTDKYITNHAITFNDYFMKAVSEEILPSVDWWSGGPIFNALWDGYMYISYQAPEDLAKFLVETTKKTFNSSSTENAKQGAKLFNSEVRELSTDQIFQISDNDNSLDWYGLTTQFATPTNQQKTDMGETVNTFLDEQTNADSSFEQMWAPCCGGAWCSSLNYKSDTAKRKEAQLTNDKNTMENENCVEAYLLEGERTANIDALINDNEKESPNVEVIPEEMVAAAAALPFWWQKPPALSSSKKLAEIFSTCGSGGALDPYKMVLNSLGEVISITGKIKGKVETFVATGKQEFSSALCEKATEKIFKDQFQPWGGGKFSPDFFKINSPGYLKYTGGNPWQFGGLEFGKINLVDSAGKKSTVRLLNGDVNKCARFVQATIDAKIARDAVKLSALAAANKLPEELARKINSTPDAMDNLNELFGKIDESGSTLGKDNVHIPSRKKSPQAIQHDFNDIVEGSGICEKPKPENCLSRSVKTTTNLSGDPSQRLDGFDLAGSSPEEVKRAVDADKVLKVQTTQKGVAKPVVDQPIGKAVQESAECRNNRKYLEELKRIEDAFQGKTYGGRYAGNQVWKSQTIKMARQVWKQVYQLPIAGMVGWLSADYIAQKNCLADQLREASEINRLKKSADAYNCATDTELRRIVDEYIRNHPAFSPLPSYYTCSTFYKESGCAVCSECKNNCNDRILLSCMPLSSGRCASDRKCLYVDALTTCTTPFYQNVNDSGCVEDSEDLNFWWYGQSVPLKKSHPSAIQEFWNDPPQYFPW